MTTQYSMTAIYNGTTRIYWVVTGAPDNTGQYSGYPTNLLTSITTNYTTSSGVTSTGVSTSSLAWQTAVEIDLTAQPTQTLSGDGTYTIAGYTWTKINSANERQNTVLTNGTGITWYPSSNGDLYNSTRTLPALYIPLTSFIPNFTLDMPIRVWLYESTNNEAQSYDSCVLAMEYPSTNTNYVLKRSDDGSQVMNASANFNGGNQGQTNSTGVYSNNVLVVECPDGVGSLKCRQLGGVYNNGFPGYQTLQPIGNLNAETGQNDVQWVGLATGWNLLIGCHRAGSGNNSYTATMGRIKVEYISNSPVAVPGTFVGLYSARPATAPTGTTYRCTDAPFAYVYDGTTWQQNYQGLLTTPYKSLSAPTSWTPINLTSGEYGLKTGDGYYLQTNSNDNAAMHGYIVGSITPGVGGAWTVTLAMSPQLLASNYALSGLVLYDTNTSRYTTWFPYVSTSGLGLGSHGKSSPTSQDYASGGGDNTVFNFRHTILWLRVYFDGTNYNFQFSYDGTNYFTYASGNIGVVSGAPGGWMTPNQYGFMVQAESSGRQTAILVLSETQT